MLQDRKKPKGGSIAATVGKLKAGEHCQVKGHPYGVVRTSVWRFARKYSKRLYQCRNIGGAAWVFRIK